MSASRRSPSKSGKAPATTNSCGDAGGVEAAAPEAAELDRVVDERVVVGGDELVRAAPPGRGVERRRDLPAGRQAGAARARAARASWPSTRRHTPVPLKKPRDGVEEGGAHRGVEGVDLVAHDERRRRRRSARSQVALSSCSQRQRRAALLGARAPRDGARTRAPGSCPESRPAGSGAARQSGRSMRSSTEKVWRLRRADVDDIADHGPIVAAGTAAAIAGKMATLRAARSAADRRAECARRIEGAAMTAMTTPPPSSARPASAPPSGRRACSSPPPTASSTTSAGPS